MKKVLFFTLAFSILNVYAQTNHPGVPSDPSDTAVMGGSTPSGAQTRNDRERVETLNSIEEMRERNNNSSIQTEAQEATDSDCENYDRARNKKEREAQKGN
jgi:hypothetical protein